MSNCYRKRGPVVDKGKGIPLVRVVLMVLIFIVLVPLLPLLITGRWDWWQAWVYALINIVGFVSSRALAARRHADLLQERARFLNQPDAKPWDKVLSPLVGLGGVLIPLAAGVDVLFNGLGRFSMGLQFVAMVLMLCGYVLGAWALFENRFFSGMVRIQSERGHTVVSSGPYRWVRHPGYAGAMLTYFVTPLLLDSPWAFVPAVLLGVVLVIRTRLEDKTLMDELPGYRAYAVETRYRLLPGVW